MYKKDHKVINLSGRLFLLPLLIILMAPLLYAEETKPVVIFGSVDNHPPFVFKDSFGVPQGFEIELFNAIAEKAGWNKSIRIDDLMIIKSELANGRIDVIPTHIPAEYNQPILYSNSIMSENHRIFGLSGKNSYGTIDALARDSTRVAVEEGSYAWGMLREIRGDIKIVPTNNDPASIKMIVAGKADVAITPSHIGYYTIAQESLNNIVALSPPLLPVDYAFAINPDRPELVASINEALFALQSEGQLDALDRKWLHSFDVADRWSDLRELWWLLLPVGLLIIGLCWALWRYRYAFLEATGSIKSAELRIQAAEDRAKNLSVNDGLTALPKHEFLEEYLKSSLLTAKEQNTQLAVGILKLLEVEYLSLIVGDKITRELIKLQADALAEEHNGFTAYLGEGRFAFVMEDNIDIKKAINHMRKLTAIAGQEYDVEGTPIEIMVASGLAFYPEHAYRAEDLIRAAKAANVKAEEQNTTILVYNTSMEPDPRNLTLISDLKKALSHDALEWLVQPQYDLEADRVTGGELLVRWKHPRYGWVPPGVFIPLAEKTGLIDDVTRAAVQQAKAVLKEWRENGHEWDLSLNVSGNDLADDSLVDEIMKELADYAALVTLEMTETAVMKDVSSINHNIERIKTGGISKMQMALDDYGTGYSSLEYLKQVEFEKIKIDMTFIKNIVDSERDRKLTQASIILAHDLGARVVAEGVEDEHIAALLKEMNCDILQGYGIAKPLRLEEFETFSADYTLQLSYAFPKKYVSVR